MSPSVKILISQKKYSKLLRSEIFTPIQTGAAISPERYDDMLHDDVGENISARNDFFCELTAIFWAWKNYDKLGAPDYIGFMHNRRHFIFNDREFKIDSWGYVPFADFNDEYLHACSLQDERVRAMLEGVDAILPREVNVGLTVREQYARYHPVANYDAAIRLLKDKHPEDALLADAYSSGENAYYWLMGIYRKEIFFRYCEWLFPLLFELFERIDFTGYTAYQARVCGFIAERLTGIFFRKLEAENTRLKKLHVTFLHRAESLQARYNPKPLPVFGDDACTVVMSANNKYVPFLATCISSLLEHASADTCYDLIIFERDISDINKQVLKEQYARPHVSLRFFNLSDLFKDISLPLTIGYITEETYFRLLIPSVLSHYKKILYVDIDLYFAADANLLYRTDIGDHPIACVRDYVYAALVNKNESFMKYSRETLKLREPHTYYNAGVMLMNIDYFRRHNCTQELLNLATQNRFIYMEQCALNSYFAGQIWELPTEWNYMVSGLHWESDGIWDNMPILDVLRVRQARKDAKIVHFAGPYKPWLNQKTELADIYMQHAKSTPFYDDILQVKCEDAERRHHSAQDEVLKLLAAQYTREHRLAFGLRYLLFCLKYLVLRKPKYKEKKRALKQRLRDAKLLTRQLRHYGSSSSRP